MQVNADSQVYDLKSTSEGNIILERVELNTATKQTCSKVMSPCEIITEVLQCN